MEISYNMKAWQLRGMLERREVSALEVLDSVLKRVEETEPTVKAYLTLTRDDARATAEATDLALSRDGAIGRIAGIPMAVKDVLCTRGIKTTCGSLILEN